MGIRNIRINDDPILKKKSRPIDKFDERLYRLLDDMKDTLHRADGSGLAAVQVGALRRVVIVDCGDGLLELINPELVEQSGEQYEVEGCLSLPGRSGITVRPKNVRVRAQDREGNWREYLGEGLKARAFCHELDHLDGHLYTERLAPREIAEKVKKAAGKPAT